jgi:hypothetical protein
MKRPKHPLDDLTKPEILRVRKGDIAATQKMMRQCALNLRELTSDGRNNLHSLHAVYLSQVLKRLAKSEKTARLFCLGMPKHRPKQNQDSRIHIERARKVLAWYQRGGTLDAAIKAVADREHKSIGAIRASWKAKGFVAEFQRLYATPKQERGKVKLPGALNSTLPQEKGET